MRLRRKRPAPEAVTEAQRAAARKLARETVAADHLAVERYARQAVPDLQDAALTETQPSEDENHDR